MIFVNKNSSKSSRPPPFHPPPPFAHVCSHSSWRPQHQLKYKVGGATGTATAGPPAGCWKTTNCMGTWVIWEGTRQTAWPRFLAILELTSSYSSTVQLQSPKEARQRTLTLLIRRTMKDVWKELSDVIVKLLFCQFSDFVLIFFYPKKLKFWFPPPPLYNIALGCLNLKKAACCSRTWVPWHRPRSCWKGPSRTQAARRQSRSRDPARSS